jgi:hypothetical protein
MDSGYYKLQSECGNIMIDISDYFDKDLWLLPVLIENTAYGAGEMLIEYEDGMARWKILNTVIIYLFKF